MEEELEKYEVPDLILLPQKWNALHDTNYCKYFQQTLNIEDEETYRYCLQFCDFVSQGAVILSNDVFGELKSEIALLN